MCSAIISDGRTARRRQGRDQLLRRIAQHREGAVAALAQLRIGVDRNAGFEHRRVIGGLGARKGEIGFAEPVERRHRIGTAVVPGFGERRLELLEAAQRDVRQEFVAVAEMPVRRRRADAGPTGGLRKSEAGRAFFGNQLQRGAQQRLFQVAVMVAARPGSAAVFGPAHVNGLYMSRRAASTAASDGDARPVQACAGIPGRRASRGAAVWGSAARGRRRQRPPSHARRSRPRRRAGSADAA